MKNFITTLASLLIITSIAAQAPERLSYQAVIRDGNGDVITEREVGVRIRILRDSEFGAAVYVETHQVETNSNGLVALQIGGGHPIEGVFSEIEWATEQLFIQTETDPNGGENYSISGTSQLLSVPYALYANTSGSVDDYENYFEKQLDGEIFTHDKLGIGIDSPEEQLHVNGNIKVDGDLHAQGNLNLSGHINSEGGMTLDGDITSQTLKTNQSASFDRIFINPDENGNFSYIVFRNESTTGSPRMYHSALVDKLFIHGMDALTVMGDLEVTGSKSFIHPHPDNPDQQIRYVALEGAEAGVYWRGSATTKSGRIEIKLPEHFALVTSEQGLTVNLTPHGAWAPLYVKEVSPYKLVVAVDERYSDEDVAFDFIVNGIRIGYEGFEAIEDVDSGDKTSFSEN